MNTAKPYTLMTKRLLTLLRANPVVISLNHHVPLDRALTKAIAAALSIQHPHQPNGDPATMTTDILIEVRTWAGVARQAIAVMDSHQLTNRRTLEKLEIEVAYHASKGTTFTIVTERDLSRERLNNLINLRCAQ